MRGVAGLVAGARASGWLAGRCGGAVRSVAFDVSDVGAVGALVRGGGAGGGAGGVAAVAGELAGFLAVQRVSVLCADARGCSSVAAGGRGRGAGGGAGACWRGRCWLRPACRAVLAGVPRARAGERVRADGDHDHATHVVGRGGLAGRRRGADRGAGGEYAGVRAGPVAVPGAGRGGGGAVCGGGGAGAGVSRAGGADCGSGSWRARSARGERMYRTGDLARWPGDGAAGVRWGGPMTR